MTSHSYHPPDQGGLILKDDCARCAEHAEHPWESVDRGRLTKLIVIALRWQYGAERLGPVPAGWDREPGSENERRACAQINRILNPGSVMLGGTHIPEYVMGNLRKAGLIRE